MCIRVAVVDDLSAIAIWDPDEVTILVDRGTHPHDLIRELDAILTIDLGAPTLPGAGLTCFCGEPVELPFALTTVTTGASTL
ncbi:hypothetical protein [Streptomyces brasiliscabiei]|uniref:hypothetical protein n=1 Tax=Streptomyces brasiliscabiei TaxID=2736302 RepID=UPI001C12095C|nr:hypothetical protein [Streptomyces brasiliscabiei]